MPEGKSISFQPGEYPELDGIKNGSKIKFSGEATIQTANDGSGSINITAMDLETEGPATRELKKMTQRDNAPAGNEYSGDDF